MDKRQLKSLVQRLKEITAELESEIYSDTESYTLPNVSYEDVLEYYQATSSAEEGL